MKMAVSGAIGSRRCFGTFPLSTPALDCQKPANIFCSRTIRVHKNQSVSGHLTGGLNSHYFRQLGLIHRNH